jgi:hypothetical protein
MTEIRIGTRRTEGGYEGVLRVDGIAVFACGHAHHNRDTSTQTSGRSARSCVELLVRAARFPDYAAAEHRDIVGWPARYARLNHLSPRKLAEWQADAERAAAAYDAQVAQVASITGSQAVWSYGHDRPLFPAVAQAGAR